MRILLTNDDGADSPGILLLAEALRGAGHRVIMVAPSSNNSAISHAISFFKRSWKFAEIERDSYSLDGTPVDCVAEALRGNIPGLGITGPGEWSPPDAVISGINRGANLGTDIVFSGTAAAARQGAFCGIPSLALSLSPPCEGGENWRWDAAVAFVLERFDEMLAGWKPDSFINVNIPNRGENPLGLVRAFPSLRFYNDSRDVCRMPDGSRYCIAKPEETGVSPDEGSDWEAIAQNNASLSEIFIHPVLLEHVSRRC